jgi:hypothetical protein
MRAAQGMPFPVISASKDSFVTKVVHHPLAIPFLDKATQNPAFFCLQYYITTVRADLSNAQVYAPAISGPPPPADATARAVA